MALSPDTVESLKAFFNHVDTDHDGHITVDEIREAMGVDYNSDNVISQDEKLRAGAQWIDTHLPLQDLDKDQKLTLQELLEYNLPQT